MPNSTNSSKRYDPAMSPTLLDSRSSVSHSLSLAFMITKKLRLKYISWSKEPGDLLCILTNFFCFRLARRFGGHQGEHLRKVCVCIEPRYFCIIYNKCWVSQLELKDIKISGGRPSCAGKY